MSTNEQIRFFSANHRPGTKFLCMLSSRPLPSCPPLHNCCRRRRATTAAKLPPPLPSCLPWPSCHRCRRAATVTAVAMLPPSRCHQDATAVAKLPTTTELPLPPLRCRCRHRTTAALSKALPPLPKSRFRQAAASATKLAAAPTLPLLPLSLQPPRCHHRGACHAAAKLLPPPPSCRHLCLRRRASPRPFQHVPAGAYVDCCVIKGCNQVDPSKWVVRLQHGFLVPSQSPGQVSLSYFDWEKRAAFPSKKHSTPSSAQPHVASDAFDF
jgi:hypothetical protein